MSWRDRPYASEPDHQPELRIRFPKPSTAVVWIVIANVAIHFIHVVSTNWFHAGFGRTFGLSLAGVSQLHFWQPFTYMFVHSTMGIWHLVFNMLLLYFIGSEVERGFGRDRFLQFYATCGVVGGVAYLGLAAIDNSYFEKPLVGASGAVYGLLLAAMIFFPQMRIVFIIFPMPIRVFGGILIAIFLLQLAGSGKVDNLGGEVCHIGGAVTGIVIFYAWGIMPKIRFGSGQGSATSWIPGAKARRSRAEGAWARKQKKRAEAEAEVDRILQKVHDEGVNRLTRREKKMLEEATRRQKQEEKGIGRIDRL